MAQRMAKKKPQQRGQNSRPFRHTSDKARHKLEVKRWQLEEEEAKHLKAQYESIDSEDIAAFADLPLSIKTKTGLRMAGYKVPTEIQRATVGLALQGWDVLGAAKTGSGKTLAFLMPVLECLYRSRWSKVDGLGALVISPTRELAYQTFEVLCKVGKKHDFSAALIIGGKDVKEEMERIARTNIVVCTPGRFLHHLDQAVSLDCSNLQILVLDEADRILDLGFEKTMNAILESLPVQRQTLLFSATQTKSVRDLARLSLKDPKYVAVHQHHEFSTPAQLEQSYIVCDLDQKVDLLYSFIRNHTKSKTLVFMASCKQVKYTFEVFCSLHPGVTVMALYGTLHQLRRVAIYNEFCKKDAAVLFATDIAARGLDFPAVNWVLQLDCPEDASTYIHRVGRTARYERGGESLLVLLPSEEAEMTRQLEERKIPLQKINVNPNRKMSIQKKLMSMCASSQDLKQSAQRCFINYVKSVYLMKDKGVFDVNQLPLEKYSFSLGLAIPPRVRFLQRASKRKEEQQRLKRQREASQVKEGSEEEEVEEEESAAGTKTVLRQRRQGPDLVMEEEEAEEGVDADPEGLAAIVAKLKTSLPRRSAAGASIKVKARKKEEDEDGDLEEAEIRMMQRQALEASDGPEAGRSGDETGKKSSSKARRTSAAPLGGAASTPDESAEAKPSDVATAASRKPEPEQSESGSDEEDSQGGLKGLHGDAGFQDDADEEEDFLVVKKKDVFGTLKNPRPRDPAAETIEGAKHSSKSKKPLSKIASAKKLLRMKFAVNTKKVFDEEGEVAKQWPQVQHTAVPDDDVTQPTEGGIDIEKAKQWMRQEDQHDKLAYRERIRAKHKAERMKAKEERRKLSRKKQGKDSGSEDEDVTAVLNLGEDYVPFDPDMLPDPDKYASGGSETEQADIPRAEVKKKRAKKEGAGVETPRKRKAKLERQDGERTEKKKKKKKEKKAQLDDSELTLQDQEELALHILSSSKF